MKLLITGGNGFIAKHLRKEFNNKYQVLSPNSHELDLLDENKVLNYLKAEKFDVILHCATYDAAPIDSPKDPAKVLVNNLRMFFNLTRGQNYFGKMLYFGSGAEYNRENWIPNMKESYFDQHVPKDQYGYSKYLMTKHAKSSHKIFNLRLFAVFGEYDNWRYRFISNVCCKAVLNLPIVFKQNKLFDFLYIKDLIKIVNWFMLNQPKKQIYNVCSGQGIDFKSVAEKIIKISGKKLELVIKAPGLGTEYSGDNALLLKELQDFKFTPIDQALKTVYDWYASNKDTIKKDEFHY